MGLNQAGKASMCLRPFLSDRLAHRFASRRLILIAQVILAAAVVAPPMAAGAPLPTKKHLVVLCAFSNHYDEGGTDPIGDNGFAPSYYNTLFNGIGGDPVIAPGGSVKDYFKYNTYGQWSFDSTITPQWIKLPNAENPNVHGMIDDALDRLDEREIIDFEDFDENGDGIVDFITLIFSGHGVEPDNRVLIGGNVWTSASGIKVKSYQVGPALMLGTSQKIITPIGYFCHQFGHLLGLPDLFDTDESSYGIGRWGLMGTPLGEGFGPSGSSAQYPPHLCAWSRVQLGLVEPYLINDPEVDDFWGTYYVSTGFADDDDPDDPNYPVHRINYQMSASSIASGLDGIRVAQQNAEKLVADLLGPGINIVEGTPKLKADNRAAGVFRAGSSAGIGMQAGIILSTGDIFDALGPNKETDTGTGLGDAGDSALNNLAENPTTDAAVLEFKFQFEDTSSPTADLYLNFVFASEEYTEFIGDGDYADPNSTGYDVLAVYVDGVNIALVPGTTDPVNVKTVRPEIISDDPNLPGQPGDNEEYYVDNDPNTTTKNIEFDGFTIRLEAKKTGLSTSAQHTVKIAIADAGGTKYGEAFKYDLFDSAILLQAGSLSNLPNQSKIPVTEYLLIENRQPSDSERYMPQGGLAIWHIDEFKFNNDSEGYPGMPPVIIPPEDPNDEGQVLGWPELHYMVALIQADNDYDLEKLNNRGDSTDLYRNPDFTIINGDTTYPNTHTYGFGVDYNTRISISQISGPGGSMTYSLADRTNYNDDCKRATALTESQQYPFISNEEPFVYEIASRTVYGSRTRTPDGQTYYSDCAGFDPIDAWHIFTPPVGGGYTISLCNEGTDFDTTLEVFADCDNLDSLACNDDSERSGFYRQSELSMTLEEGIDYLIRVAGYNNETGYYFLTATYKPPFPNDGCGGAFTSPISQSVPYEGSLVSATATPDPVNPNLDFATPGYDWGDYIDAWHTFSPSRTCTVTMLLHSDDFDTTLGVYANNCDNLQLLAANNNCPDLPENNCDDCSDSDSKLSIPIVKNNIYLIRVAGNDDFSGDGTFDDYVLTISEPPYNDDCTGAAIVSDYMVTGLTYTGVTTNATPTDDNGSSLVSSCGADDIKDLWYLYIPTESEEVTVTLSSNSFDTTLAIFSDCQLTELACDDQYPGEPEQITMPMTAEQEYLIRVAGWGGQAGEFELTVIGGGSDGILDLRILPPWEYTWYLTEPIDISCVQAYGGVLPYLNWMIQPREQIPPYEIGDPGQLSMTGTPQEFYVDEAVYTEYTLPFDFPFYNVEYPAGNVIRISSNGFVELGGTAGPDHSNSTINLMRNIRIAPLWDDLYTRNPFPPNNNVGDIYIDHDPEADPSWVMVRWKATTFSYAMPCNFAVTLFSDGQIKFDYGTGNTILTPTVGISAGNETDYILVEGYDGAANLANANSVLFVPPFERQAVLPPGITFDTDGCFSGTPGAVGEYPITVTVDDSSGHTTQQDIDIYAINRGDINRDIMVNLIDFALLASQWLIDGCAEPDWCERTDINQDTQVDVDDLAKMAVNWLKGQSYEPPCGGGSGTPSDPFIICTAEQLNAIGTHPGTWDKHFKLMNNIDLSGYTGTDFNIIGYVAGPGNYQAFSGVFDGNGRIISNFTYDATGTSFPDNAYIGLFGFVNGSAAQVKNLSMTNVNITAEDGKYIGGLIGWLREAQITNCSVEGGSIAGNNSTGGMIGAAAFTTDEVTELTGPVETIIDNCHATCAVSGVLFIGGLVGTNNVSDIENCYAAGDVSGSGFSYYIGGLAGSCEMVDISYCYAAGTVSGANNVGGLAGKNTGQVTQCFATGDVIGTSQSIGGLVGSSYAQIEQSYAAGSVSGNDKVGGLIGKSAAGVPIIHCYASGVISGATNIGALTGYDNSSIYTKCFWDNIVNDTITGVGNISDPADVIAQSTTNMQQEITYTSAGWDFTNIWTIAPDEYPKLQWQTP